MIPNYDRLTPLQKEVIEGLVTAMGQCPSYTPFTVLFDVIKNKNIIPGTTLNCILNHEIKWYNKTRGL